MKKYIVFALCICLLIVAAVPAMAAEETNISVTPSQTALQRGDTVEFTVSISGDVPFTSIMVALNFDEQFFEFVSSREGDGAGSFMVLPYSPNAPEVGLLTMNAPMVCVGAIQVITFRIRDDAPLETVEITGDGYQGQSAGEKINVTFQGTQVSIGCEHTYDWSKTDDSVHKGICSKCGGTKEEKHTLDEGTAINPATCTEAGEEKYVCTKCDASKIVTVEAQGHAWESDCDALCDACGETRDAGHKYGEAWKTDAENHWYECEVCGDKKDEAAHIPGEDATEWAAQTCTVCKYIIKPQLEHVHAFSDDWQNDVDNHWKFCMKAGCLDRGEESKHDYDNNCDITCNTCGYIRVAPHNYGLELLGNAQGHWFVCHSCDNQSQVQPHVPGAEATEDTPQVCEDCNYWIKFPLSHVHKAEEAWTGDEENHWHSCSECDEMLQSQPHTWDAGVVTKQPTETENGSKQYTCTVCNKQKEEVIPANSQPTTAPSAPTEGTTPSNPTNPTRPAEQNQKSGSWWWIVAAAAILLLVVGIILLVIELIRSSKHNMHGKFSK